MTCNGSVASIVRAGLRAWVVFVMRFGGTDWDCCDSVLKDCDIVTEGALGSALAAATGGTEAG